MNSSIISNCNRSSHSSESPKLVCINCKQDLNMDSSGSSTFSLLGDSNEFFEPLDSSQSNNESQPPKIPLDESFQMVDKCDDDAERVTPKMLSMCAELLSEHPDICHPLCLICADKVLEKMDEDLKFSEEKVEKYKECLSQLKGCHDIKDVELLEEQLAALKMEEESLLKSAVEVTEKLKKGEEHLKYLEKQRQDNLEEEKRYIRECQSLEHKLLQIKDDDESLNNQLLYASSSFNKLIYSQVFYASFCIDCDKHIGSINNFRLGRLPDVAVSWEEINTAWGLAVQLLHALGKTMNLKFSRYRLVPYGDRSCIQTLEGKEEELPLYCFKAFGHVWDVQYDRAMVAFLDCLHQLKIAIESENTLFDLPYQITQDRIRDSNGYLYSIKTALNSVKHWSAVLRCMLTILQRGQVWVTAMLEEVKENP